MSFAKRFIFETIRTVRRVGTVGLFAAALLIGSGVIAALTENGTLQSAAPTSMSANAATYQPNAQQAGPAQPWSRVVGGRQFERVTDVVVSEDLGVMFAGVSVSVGTNDASEALIVRTDPHGFVHAQALVSDPRIGSVSRAILDDAGEARLVHWVDARPAFAKTDSHGNVVWSRVFEEFGESVWVDIAAAARGQSLIAVANSDQRLAGLRVMRVDASGSVLWRRDLGRGKELGALSMADSQDGGALLAIENMSKGIDGPREIDLVRLDRHGRIAWTRNVFAEPTARMADADINADGGAMLIHGATAALYRFDGLGGLQWVREVPGLAADGRHLVTTGDSGAINVLAEPRRGNSGRRHWLAQFDDQGRLNWSHTRANRLDASLEAVTMARNGMLVAGGSLVTASHGDTDMLMLTVGADGTFPSGYGAVERLNMPATTTLAQTGPAPSPVVAASLIVDNAMSLPQVSSASSTFTSAPNTQPAQAAEPQLAAIDNTQNAPQLALAAATPNQAPPAMREVAAVSKPKPEAAIPERATAAMARPDTAPAGSVAPVAPRAAASPSASPARSAVAAAAQPPAVAAPTTAPEVRRAAFSPTSPRSKPHSFECTFTCLADSEDIVRYPVTRLIENVDETNAALFSLDVMAMDTGVCLATGGRVYDAPRLPPVCEIVD